MASAGRVAGATRSLVNDRNLQLECARVLNEILLVAVLMYGNETIISKEKERPRIRTVHIDSLRVLLCIRRRNKVSNARLREL